MSNLPPGVSGFEPAIAGAQSEWDEERTVECGECDWSGDVTGTVSQWSFWERSFWWECPQCGHEHDTEDEPDEPEAPEYEPYEDDPDWD